MSNRVVHFEIPCAEPEKTIKFFSSVFGWKFEQFGTEDYWSVTTGDENVPGINGGLMRKKDPNQPIANSIQVEDLDQKMEEITKAGGSIVVPKMPIPTIGYLAYFKDPDGNIHGLFMKDKTAVYHP